MYLTQSISARDTRYQSAVRIQKQPRIYFPRFSWIWDRRREATTGSPVVYEEESKVEGSRRSAACYLVGFAISAYTVTAHYQFRGERFCFVLNNARPLLPLEKTFFESARAAIPLILQTFRSLMNILQYLSSRSSPNSMIWWHRSMTSIKMTRSIVNLRRNKCRKSSETHCTGIPFHRVQMSASKASAG